VSGDSARRQGDQLWTKEKPMTDTDTVVRARVVLRAQRIETSNDR
jgi:hypothetical protein